MLPHSRHIRRQSATQRIWKPRHRESFQQLNSQILMLLLLLRPVASWNPTPQSTSTAPRQFWSLTSTRRFHLHRNPQPRWATCQRQRWNHPGAPLSPDTRALFPSVGTPTPGTGLFSFQCIGISKTIESFRWHVIDVKAFQRDHPAQPRTWRCVPSAFGPWCATHLRGDQRYFL